MSDPRKRISAAAQELYLAEGMQAVSMRKVAERVGMSAPALYRYFPNKDALLNEIVVEGLRILEGYLRPALDAETPFDRLVAMTERYVDFALEQPKYFDFAFLTPSAIDSVSSELERPDWATFRLAMEQVAQCIEQGRFRREDPLACGITIWAEVHGLVTLFRTGRFGQGEELFRHIVRDSIQRVLRGLETHPEGEPGA